jgi:hypothetical protein
MDTISVEKKWVLVVGILVVGSMFFASCCAADDSSSKTREVTLVNPPQVQDGTSFTVYVVLQSNSDGPVNLTVRLPNGFHLDEEAANVVKLKAFETKVIPLEIDVRRYVAEQDHLIRVETIDDATGELTIDETTVRVWWDWSQL